MTTAIYAPGQNFSNSQRYLWAAVGLLGAATIAMGAVLVHERATPVPVAVVAALAPEQASTLMLAPSAKLDPSASVSKEAVRPALHAQTAPKNIAIKPSRTREIVETREVVGQATPDSEWRPLSPGGAQAPKVVCATCGTVESVTPIQREAAGSGAGVVAGAVLGGLLGNQVGGGDGKTIATVIGALGGGWAGNTVEKRMKKEIVYQVEVRMEDGSTRSLEQSGPAAVGSRVTVEGNVMSPAPAGTGSGAHTAT
jgi:outer membrane lipoprotein SlyB